VSLSGHGSIAWDSRFSSLNLADDKFRIES
jgi:hypothetical protein